MIREPGAVPMKRRVERSLACVLLAAAALLAAAPCLPAVSALPVLPAALSAQQALFDEGNRLYQEGDYAAAAENYRAVVEGGFESAEVYYNLGNAHFRLGNVAHAVLNYERAAMLDPANEDVQANLALVTRMLQDRIEPLPRFWVLSVFEWWMALVPRGWLEALVAVCYIVLGSTTVALVLDRSGGRRARALRRIAYAGAVGTVVLGGTLLVREAGWALPEQAIVMAAEARVLSAPSEEGGLTVFTLHEGTRVRIDRRSGEWAEIVLADGKVGWLPLAALEEIQGRPESG